METALYSKSSKKKGSKGCLDQYEENYTIGKSQIEYNDSRRTTWEDFIKDGEDGHEEEYEEREVQHIMDCCYIYIRSEPSLPLSAQLGLLAMFPPALTC